jgi:hypothetical protein
VTAKAKNGAGKPAVAEAPVKAEKKEVKKEEEEEEVKPLAAHEFPSLGAAVKIAKGRKALKGRPAVAEIPVEESTVPAALEEPVMSPAPKDSKDDAAAPVAQPVAEEPVEPVQQTVAPAKVPWSANRGKWMAQRAAEAEALGVAPVPVTIAKVPLVERPPKAAVPVVERPAKATPHCERPPKAAPVTGGEVLAAKPMDMGHMLEGATRTPSEGTAQDSEDLDDSGIVPGLLVLPRKKRVTFSSDPHEVFGDGSAGDSVIFEPPPRQQEPPRRPNRRPGPEVVYNGPSTDRNWGLFTDVLPASSSTAPEPKHAEGETDRMDDLKRSMVDLLNKVCPDTVAYVAAKIAELKVASVEELRLVISLIFKKALAEPHYCGTYADLVFTLKGQMLELPSPDGGKPVSFKICLINSCQTEFETMPKAFVVSAEEASKTEAAELEYQMKLLKDRVLANMKFIGQLFMRQLITSRIIGYVLVSMVQSPDSLPEEHMIECTCELLAAVGQSLETSAYGQDRVTKVCDRLLDLKTRLDANATQAYCKRIQFRIQDVLEMKEANWVVTKVLQPQAKTREEIRREQEREFLAKSAVRRG